MKAYEAYLKSKQIEVNYVEAIGDFSDIRQLITQLKRQGITHLNYIDTTDKPFCGINGNIIVLSIL